MRDLQALTDLPNRPPTTIGVMGSTVSRLSSGYVSKCYELGRAIARRGFALTTGAYPGLPLHAAHGAKDEGGMTVGFSPCLSLAEHVEAYGSPTKWQDVVVFTGSDRMTCEVTAIRSSDIVVLVGGGCGSLLKLAIAYEQGKLIGVLDGANGSSDEIRDLIEGFRQDSGAHMIVESDPDRLIEKLWSYYCQEHCRKLPVYNRQLGATPEGLAS